MSERGSGSIRIAVVAGVLGVAALAAAALAGGSDEAGRAFLGVHVEEETAHPEGGARVEHVVPDSAADRLGIREGDVIQGLDGSPVRGPGGLGVRLAEHAPGERVAISVQRDGKTVRLEGDLGERPAPSGDEDWAAHWADYGEKWAEWAEQWAEHGEEWAEWGERFGEELAGPWRSRRPLLGVGLVEPTPELRVHLGGGGSAGVLVSKVVSGSPAEDAGIRVGDMIVGVDGEPVESTTDLVRALGGRSGSGVSIDLIRDRRHVAVEVALPEVDDPENDVPRAYFAPPVPPAPPAPALPAPAPPAFAPPAPPAPPLAPRPPPRPARPVSSLELAVLTA